MFGEWWAFPVVVGACVWDFERKVPGWWKVTRPLLGVSLLIWVAGVWVRIWREAGEAECFEEAMREVKRNGRWWRSIGGRG
jgi:hypothetical protein